MKHGHYEYYFKIFIDHEKFSFNQLNIIQSELQTFLEGELNIAHEGEKIYIDNLTSLDASRLGQKRLRLEQNLKEQKILNAVFFEIEQK